MKLFNLALALLLCPFATIAQEDLPDSLKIQTPEDTLRVEELPDTTESDLFFTSPNVASDEVIVAEEDPERRPHSPGRAALFSAILPGLGQAYNKKYWKIPIVYAGVGVSVYFLQYNIGEINYFKESYLNATDGDPNTFNTSGFNTGTLQDLIAQHRKWRDYSILGLVAVYLLNIIDANVDGHMFYFDVSKDLSMSVSPSMQFTAQPTPGFTLCLKL